MKKWAILGGLILFLTSLMLPFTNCSQVRQGSKTSESTAPKGNGDFYTGKTYVAESPSLCGDGSNVAARLRFVSDNNAQMLRDNCAELANPQPIAESSITKNGDTLFVDGRTFTYETSALTLNGGFEQGLDGWSVLGGSPQISADSTDGASALTTVAGDEWTWLQQGIHPTLYVPGQSYTLRATAKIAGGSQPVRIALKADNGDLATLVFTALSYESQEISFVWPSGLSWSVLYIELGKPNGDPTIATVDSISLTPN